MGTCKAARRVPRNRLQGGAELRSQFGGGVPLRHGKTFQQVLPELPDCERGNKAARPRKARARTKHARRDEKRDGLSARAFLGEDVIAKRSVAVDGRQ